MTVSAADLGDVERLARAIGLLQDGGFNDDWLSNPARYLGSVLSDDGQRAALLAAVDDLLGGGDREADAQGFVWLPLFERDDPALAFAAVIDERAADHVAIGVGVKLSAEAPHAAMRLHIPLFKAARGNTAIADPILLGRAGGRITFACDITVDPAAPSPGQAHLAAVGLRLDVPTDGSAPDFGIALSGLQLPGATAPRDLSLSMTDAANLDDVVLDLVLGLIEAQARQAGGAVQHFARLVGLADGTAIPRLPLDQFALRGVAAIGDWAGAVFGAPAAHDAWLTELAGLFGGSASVAAGRVAFDFGVARVRLGVDTAPGSGGLPIIMPVLALEVGAAPRVAKLAATLLRFDLGARTAVALPALDAFAALGRIDGAGTPLLAGDPAVDAIRLGVTLGGGRRIAATLAALNVKIGANPVHPILDLSSPDAVVADVGQVLDDVAASVLDALGSLKPVLGALFGLAPPAGVAPVSFATFLRDPLAAVRAYWRTLVVDNAAAVPTLLASVRDLIADGGTIATAVGGTGTPADPWTIALVGPVDLQIVRVPGVARVEVALVASYMNDTLGQRCTRLDADIGVGLATLDLDGGACAFLTSVTAGLRGRPRGVRRTAIELPPMRLSADSVGLAARWTPSGGLTLGMTAPNPALAIDDVDIPLDIPDFSAGLGGLSDAQWDALEFLAGQLARRAPASWLRDLAEGIGWGADDRTQPRLSLAALVSAPQDALVAWARDVLLRESSRLEALLAPLARVLTGTVQASGVFDGTGAPADPYRIPLSVIPGTPDLCAWVEPNGLPFASWTNVTERLRAWRPGAAGLSPGELAEALVRETRAAADVAGIVAQRGDVAAGLTGLVERFTGSDGRILAPASEPAGVSVHLVEDTTAAGLSDAVAVEDLLAAVPATTIHVAVAASFADAPWPSAPDDRMIDLTAAGLAPNAFTPPSAATGEWFVALGPRNACRLASGDADGVAGQAGRLQRILEPFRALGGGLALVAEGGAGHAARIVAQAVPEVTALVTLGTPSGPVAFSVVTSEPAASTLRLLDALLPPQDEEGENEDVFDDDLARGRDLVRGLLALADTPSLAEELAPPADPAPALRVGLDAHAVYGVIGADSVARALTAIVAAGLGGRAAARAADPQRIVATGLGAGLRLPIALGTGAVTVTGFASQELFGADFTGVPALRGTRPLTVHLELRRANGWLVGGPGAAGAQDLRWLEFNLTVPLGAGGAARAEVVLHEARVFGIKRERWIVLSAANAGAGTDVATPALPEVGVLLSGVIRELTDDADPGITAAIDVLEAAGVFSIGGGQGGFVAAALDSILNQPDVHFRALVANAASRTALSAALTQVLAPIPGLTVDLAQGRLALSLSGAPAALGLLPWAIDAAVTTAGALSGALRLGPEGACLRVNLDPLTVAIERSRPDKPTPDVIALWPNPDPLALLPLLPPALIATATRIGLDYLRELDETARPIIDAALDGLGLLTGDAERSARVPLALLSHPVAWMRSQAAFGDASGKFAPARAAAFVDALKPLLGVSGGPGEIVLAPGVSVTVVGAGDALRLGLAIDGAAFAAPAGGSPRLAFGGTFALDIGNAGTLRPNVDAFVGLTGAAAGRQAAHLTIGDAVRLFLRPQDGTDISLYPDPPGLGAVAGAALQALPFVLDKIAEASAPPLAATGGQIVGAVGDALDLRSGTPAKFDSAKLAAWAQDPAARFAAQLPALQQSTLTNLAAAVAPALPAGVSVTAPANALKLVVGPLDVTFATGQFGVTINLDVADVPFAEKMRATVAFDGSGLKSFTGTAGPAAISVNGIALRPLLGFAAGANPDGGARVELGAALDAAGADAVFARWTNGAFALVSRTATTESVSPQDVARSLLRIALDLVARFAMQTPAVQTLLDKPTAPLTTVAGTTIRTLFRGVFLEDTAVPAVIDSTLFDPARMGARFMRLLTNVAGAGPSVPIRSGLTVGVLLDGTIVKLTLGVNGRVDLTSGDVRVSIEADTRWIKTHPQPGLAIGLVDTAGPTFRPSLAVNGIGVRVARASGPLVDTVFKLGSVAVHLFADLSDGGSSGGAQLQLSDLAVGAGGASGGGNAVAQGIMGDTGSGSNALAPAFSPALAVQKYAGGPVLLSLTAGEGDGPWWLSIQKGFGPLYIEQVGFGVTVREDQLQKISVLFDGRVSIAGLVAAVDDLQLTFTVTSGASLFEASNWTIDLAGLAVSADLAGVTLSGGLRKFGTEPNVEYVGMLMARVATYGISIYGGYGTGVSDGVKFTAFFAFGAVTGPFGGPPAFFLTGIGGGFGINRDLVFPQTLQTFADFVMIKALDPSASPSSDPMAELARVRDTFPMRRDRFWFAAGISFTSFALVDGVAVVAVSFGGGFELTLLGLARMALPRPQFRLVSIELGLIARFSSRDGVMWIQAELTENSWLLHESVRLTGGFAYVMWFDGARAGEFVLTLGGYHPDFHRDGYPVVPRLGFRWQPVDFISIKGENYFALTSEALMAGGAFEASATLGPAWANVSFSANAIVFFDPFRYEADAHARISAGVTIDLWLGEVTIKVSLGADLVVQGPEFHGRAHFDVGPVGVTFEFGGRSQTDEAYISWDAFVTKYLEADSPGVARVLTAVTGRGSLPPGTGANGVEKGVADGSPEKPLEVFSEFELTLSTATPATSLTAGGPRLDRPASHALGIAPVGATSMTSDIVLHLYPAAQVGQAGADRMGALRLSSLLSGAFPIGAWGPVQPRENKKVPAGDVIDAMNGAVFISQAALQETIPAEIAFNQVEAGPRKPLPFLSEKNDRARVLADAKKLVDLLPTGLGANAIYAEATPWLAAGGNTPVALASLRGDRSAPPMLGALGERMAPQTPRAAITLAQADPPKASDRTVRAPKAVAILSPLARREAVVRRTTVKSGPTRTLPPTMDEANELLATAPAKLLRVAPRPTVGGKTLFAARTPLTSQARMAPAAVDGRGADAAAVSRLKSMTAAIADAREKAADQQVMSGEIAVLSMPNARRDSGLDKRPTLTFKGMARVTMFGAGGDILADVVGAKGAPEIPPGTERIAVWAGLDGTGDRLGGFAGWHDGQSLPYVGWSTCLCRGGTVYAEGARLPRGAEAFTAGWIGARTFLGERRLVTTRFAFAAAALVVLVDEHAAGDPSADFALTLDGAIVAPTDAGEAAAPVLVASGTRRVLIYALKPDKSGVVTARILRGGTVGVAGVMASPLSADVVAARLTQESPETLLDAALANPGDPVSVRFTPTRAPKRSRGVR